MVSSPKGWRVTIGHRFVIFNYIEIRPGTPSPSAIRRRRIEFNTLLHLTARCAVRR